MDTAYPNDTEPTLRQLESAMWEHADRLAAYAFALFMAEGGGDSRPLILWTLKGEPGIAGHGRQTGRAVLSRDIPAPLDGRKWAKVHGQSVGPWMQRQEMANAIQRWLWRAPICPFDGHAADPTALEA